MVRVTDARMSGTSFGTCVLHVAPEAAVGGPLALVQDGDTITLDVAAGRLELEVDAEELSRRAAQYGRPGLRAPARLARAVSAARDPGRPWAVTSTSYGADTPAKRRVRAPGGGPLVMMPQLVRRAKQQRRTMRKAVRVRAATLIASAAVTVASLMVRVSRWPQRRTAHASASPVTLTLWENYGTEQNATATQGPREGVREAASEHDDQGRQRAGRQLLRTASGRGDLRQRP